METREEKREAQSGGGGRGGGRGVHDAAQGREGRVQRHGVSGVCRGGARGHGRSEGALQGGSLLLRLLLCPQLLEAGEAAGEGGAGGGEREGERTRGVQQRQQRLDGRPRCLQLLVCLHFDAFSTSERLLKNLVPPKKKGFFSVFMN